MEGLLPSLLKILLLSLTFTLISCDLPPLEGKVIPGIYWEESPQQQLLLYEKVVPLVFEFKIRPDLWSSGFPSGFNKFKILPRLTCRSDNKTTIPSPPLLSDWTFTCPVFYHIHEFLRQYKSNYTDINPVFRPGLRQTLNSLDYQKFSHHSSLRFDDCEQIISRQWKGIYGRDLGLTEYRTIVEKCNSLPSYFEEQIQDYNYDVTQLFENAKDNFQTFANTTQGEMVNNLLSLQSLHLLNTFSEINRLTEAQLSCQNQLIPYSFLKTARLEKTLGDLKSKLLLQKYIFPSGLSISKLLKLPLADCIFGPSTLTVQILLPVIRIESNFNLLRFTYPQFLYRDQLCMLKSSGSQHQPRNFLYDRQSRTLLSTECQLSDRELCKIPDRSQRLPLNKCIFELLNASFEGIRENCLMHCDPLTKEYKRLILPLIQRVSPSRFVITVDTITTLLIKCEGRNDELITPQIYGGVEITLPCNCYLMFHSEKFYARAPCGVGLSVKHVIPEHMINSSLIKENKFTLNELQDKVNFSLISAEEVQNVTLIDFQQNVGNLDFKFSDGNELINSTGEESNVNAQINLDSLLMMSNSGGNYICFWNHIYLWLFVLFQFVSFLLVVVILYMKINSLSKKLDYGRSAVCFSVSQMTNLDENK